MCTWNWWPFHACGQLINWGDVPTWLAGMFAAIASVFVWRTLRIERERDRVDTERYRAEQERQRVQDLADTERYRAEQERQRVQDLADTERYRAEQERQRVQDLADTERFRAERDILEQQQAALVICLENTTYITVTNQSNAAILYVREWLRVAIGLWRTGSSTTGLESIPANHGR
jgi:hypothetical protein